jgi:hypothetical protein
MDFTDAALNEIEFCVSCLSARIEVYIYGIPRKAPLTALQNFSLMGAHSKNATLIFEC